MKNQPLGSSYDAIGNKKYCYIILCKLNLSNLSDIKSCVRPNSLLFNYAAYIHNYEYYSRLHTPTSKFVLGLEGKIQDFFNHSLSITGNANSFLGQELSHLVAF